MFKRNGKFETFVKRQIAMLLAIVMAFSCFVSTGMTFETAHAAVADNEGDGGEAFVADLVEIARLGTPYVWGGWGPVGPNGGVDCRGYVRRALTRVYGLDIFETVGYLVDDNGNPVDGKGNPTNNKVFVDVAAYGARETWHKYEGMRVCVEGNGHKTFYRVLCADKLYNLDDVLDVSYNGSLYSSIIAWACQFPGTIISHNGHYGVGIGAFDSKEELLAKYPGLAGAASGTGGGMKIRWLDGAYNLGNTYPQTDTRYWFGKTVFLSACSTKSGIRADNFTTTGKDAAPSTSSDLTILLCEQPTREVNVTFKKVDAESQDMMVAGAKYGIYKDAACTILAYEFVTESTPKEMTIAKGKYYVKEISAPKNGSNKNTYQLSDQIYFLDATSDATLTLKDNPVNSTVIVQKVDANNTGITLNRTKFKIQEYNSKTSSWNDLLELKWDAVQLGFTIQTSYTNNEGNTYHDGSLHYSQTNQGQFKLVEVAAQSGYKNEGYTKVFNIADGPLILTGKNAIKNTALLAVKIVKVSPNGTRLANAQFMFDYNGQTYRGTTDANGECLFTNIEEVARKNTIKVFETRAPAGYIMTDEWLFGKDVALEKNQVVDGCYLTTIKVVNWTAEEPPVTYTQGDILMKKVDLSNAAQLMTAGVPNTYYTLYKDAALTTPAQSIDGTRTYERVKTDANGEYLFEDLPLGVYYLREVEPPTGYAIQPVTFAISLLSDSADANGNIVVRSPDNVGDVRQYVVLNLNKTDKGNNKPVPGAVYALYASSELNTAVAPQKIAAGTLLGYYVTDEDGSISVTKMGTEAFTIKQNGKADKTFEAVNPVGSNGSAKGEPLVNGTYYFQEVYAPDGYALNATKYNVDATYVMNNTDEDVATPTGGIVTAHGKTLIPALTRTTDARQNGVITFTKTDSATSHPSNHYDYLSANDGSYDAAVLNKMAASLRGAQYQLINTSDIRDYETGELILAGNVLGIYTTDAAGKFTAGTFNVGKYAGHKIPNGTYRLVEVVAPQGYAINETPINIDFSHVENTDDLTIEKSVRHNDSILKQAITIEKISSNNNTPLAGVEFTVYSVAEIMNVCGITREQIPFVDGPKVNDFQAIDRDAFLNLVKNKVEPVDGVVYTTDADGKVTTEEYVYGDYILVEANVPAEHEASHAFYIQIPTVTDVVVDDDTDTEHIVYVHEMLYQPDENYTQVVVNKYIEREFAFILEVIKKDADSGEIITNNAATFELVTSNNTQIIQGGQGNPWTTGTTGKFTLLETLPEGIYMLREIKAPDGYDRIDDITISVSKNGAQAYLAGQELNVTFVDDATYGKKVTVEVPNKLTPVIPEPETIDITVNKVWNAPVGTVLPESITVYLTKGGQRIPETEIVLGASNNWTYTWEDMLKMDGDTEIVYGVDEVVITDYTTVIGAPVKGDDTVAFTITNTLIEREPEPEPEEKVSLTVTKEWIAPNGTTLPESVIVYLTAGGQQVAGNTVTLNAANNWTHTWTELPKFDANDNEIDYSVGEVIVDGYTTQIESSSNDDVISVKITNTFVEPEPETITIYVNKVWDAPEGTTLPSSVVVYLIKNGEKVEGSEVTLNAGNQWKHIWENQLKYDDNDREITYTVGEENVEGYNKNIGAAVAVDDGISFTITNSYIEPEPEKVSVNVVKIWEAPEGTTLPESVTVYLVANGQKVDGTDVVLNAANNWEYTWTEQLKFDLHGDAIVYTVGEVVVEGYTTAISAPVLNDDVYNVAITNTKIEPAKTTVTVNKVWNMTTNAALPESVVVYLMVEGQKIDGSEVELNAANNWTHTWTNLLKYYNGTVEVNYQVGEVSVEGFLTSIGTPVDSANGRSITVTNTEIVPEPDPIITHLIVSKYEVIAQSEKAVAGAKLQIIDANGRVVAEWITTNDTTVVDEFGIAGHKVDELAPGVYTLHEAETPAGYTTADDITFTVEDTEETQYLRMLEKPTVVHVKKFDSESNVQIPGAMIQIKNSEGVVVDEFITDGATHVITHLPVGTYTAVEIYAPSGYQRAADVTFNVTDDNDPTVVEIHDDRTYGEFTIVKTDSKTGAPLKGVEFDLISVDEVVDPITNEVIFEKGEVIEHFVTDGNGKAQLTNKLPIATYGVGGFAAPIKYKLIETKAAPGQYDASAVSCDVVFQYANDQTPVVKLNFDLTNDKPSITVTKTGTPETFVGDIANKNNVTVVKNGDIITYTITVKNNGAASAWNVVVRDKIPANTEFVSIASESFAGTYDQVTNSVYWSIDEVQAGHTVELIFKVKATSDVACEIVNVAQYAMPETIPAKPEDKFVPTDDNNPWNDTDAVVHQIVEFHKTSTVKGGTSLDDATDVAIGDTIKYQMSFKAVDDVYNIVVKDKIPAGLAFISGSCKIDGVADANAAYNPDTREVIFSAVDAKNQTVIFEFEVVVEDMNFGAEKYYANIATATHDVRKGEGSHELTSEVVTHYTNKDVEVEKHGTPETFEGKASDAHDVTVLKQDDKIVYTIKATNTGLSAIKNFVITDVVPVGTKLVEVKEIEGIKSWVDETSGLITWYVGDIAKDKDVTVEFTVVVEKQEAHIIVNYANYGSVVPEGENAPKLPEDAKKTNDVVHQVIEFHKSSIVAGGKDKNDATQVAIGDTILYTLELIAKNNLTGVNFYDEIPEGLTFVPGSIKMKEIEDEEWTSLDDADCVIVDEEGTLITSPDFDLAAGKYYFQFAVTVDKIGMNSEKFYINQAFVDYDVKPNDDAEEPEQGHLASEEVSHMTFTKIEGVKTGKVETYVGDYESRQNVTVVVNGEEIVYTISVSNMGASKFDTLIIKDVVPEFTKFVSAANDGKYDEATNTVTWTLKDVEAGKTATVSFTVKVDCDNKAEEIRNKASYTVPNNPEDIKEDEWMWTDEVIHQTVELHKTSSIKHGTNEQDAPLVAIGSKFTYTITFTNKNEIYGLTIKDVLPKGLTFVKDSARYTLSGGEEVKVNDLVVGEDRTLTFPTIDAVPAGTATFSFDVTVNDVAEYDREYFFINKAEANLKTNKDSEKAVDLESETISHQTIKTNETDTPKLGFEATSEAMLWAAIALTSALAMIGCVVYVVTDKKKRK